MSPQQQPGQPAQPAQPGQPAPQAGDPQQAATTQKLDEAEQKDSGRNFELFWLDGQIGGSYINMAQFSSSKLAIENTSAGGPAFSVGAGVRFVILVLGARLRHNALSSFNLVQINGKERLNNQRRLRELNAAHASQVDVFCAHDSIELARLRAAA